MKQPGDPVAAKVVDSCRDPRRSSSRTGSGVSVLKDRDVITSMPIANSMSKVAVFNLYDEDQEARDVAYWQSVSVGERMQGLEAIRRSWLKMQGEQDDRVEGLRRVVRVIERP